MITFDELIKQHEQLWPETDQEQQENKWQEEMTEFMYAERDSEEELLELADCVIVSAGIARFDYPTGIDFLYETLESLYGTQWSTKNLFNEVEAKMEKNKKRNWEKRGDVGYHHI